jgi:hypothetical protein
VKSGLLVVIGQNDCLAWPEILAVQRFVMPLFIRGIQLSASLRLMIDPGSPG